MKLKNFDHTKKQVIITKIKITPIITIGIAYEIAINKSRQKIMLKIPLEFRESIKQKITVNKKEVIVKSIYNPLSGEKDGTIK